MSKNGIKKLYYSISEVSEQFDLKPHVLRYWETEFRQLKPKKNRAGRRVYTAADLAVVEQVQRLLRVKKYTIEGARQALNDGVDLEADQAEQMRAQLKELRVFLEKVLESL